MTMPLDRLPDSVLDQLHCLIEAVLLANQQFNLTSVRDPDDAWVKHAIDSLQGLNTGVFEEPRRVIDIGSGAGFPGLALAIARPQLQVTLNDATRKKCDFLRATVEKFELNAVVMTERAEVIGQDAQYRATFDVATARAVGSFNEVCELALPLVRVGGQAVLWRGQQAREELAAARGALAKLGGAAGAVFSYRLPGHEIDYHLVVIDKIAPTPSQFPRRSGLPKQRPLN